jgi:hypothetical protein
MYPLQESLFCRQCIHCHYCSFLNNPRVILPQCGAVCCLACTWKLVIEFQLKQLFKKQGNKHCIGTKLNYHRYLRNLYILHKALWRRSKVRLPDMYLESVNLFSFSSWMIISSIFWKCWPLLLFLKDSNISSLLVTSEDTKPNTVPINPKNLVAHNHPLKKFHAEFF